MKVFGGIYIVYWNTYGGGGKRCIYYIYIWCTVLFNSWMKGNILLFMIYTVLSNFYIKKNHTSGGWKHMSVLCQPMKKWFA